MIELKLLDGSTIDISSLRPGNVLASAELDHYKKSGSESRRREFLLGRFLLKTMLSKGNDSMAQDFNRIETIISETGKPSVPGIEFNLSHDGEAILLAIGDQVAGVDIETVQTFDDALLATCFTIAEQRRITGSRRPDRMATLLWCLKEAAVKAGGTGLATDDGLAPKPDGKLFFRGGFLTVAGILRAYAVCSPQPIFPADLSVEFLRLE
jgi:4'-phosphopantetheinyl transferase